MTREGFCVLCGVQAPLEAHHRKLRSRGGDDSPENLVDICRDCHNWIHANPAEATEQGWMVASWDEPAAVQLTVDGGEVPHEVVVAGKHDHPEVKPGEKCPTCKRRVNHPKKESSPTSKVFGMRVPLDEVDAHEELTEAVAEHLGIGLKEKYWKFKVDAVAKALVLQTSKKDLAKLLAGRGG